jgi:fructose-specific phosphotransferase system IIC component
MKFFPEYFPEEDKMSGLTFVIILALLLTIAVLATGIGSMVHGGDFDRKHGTQLMFARVGMQGFTLILLFIALYLASS